MSEFTCGNGHIMSSRMHGRCQWTYITARCRDVLRTLEVLKAIPWCDIEDHTDNQVTVCAEPEERRNVMAFLVTVGDITEVHECGRPTAYMDGKSARQLAAEDREAAEAG